MSAITDVLIQSEADPINHYAFGEKMCDKSLSMPYLSILMAIPFCLSESKKLIVSDQSI